MGHAVGVGVVCGEDGAGVKKERGRVSVSHPVFSLGEVVEGARRGERFSSGGSGLGEIGKVLGGESVSRQFFRER